MAVLRLTRPWHTLKSRSALIGAAAVAVGLVAAWAIGWYQIASSIRGRIETWAEARRAEGLTVSHGGLVVEGFPLAWHVRMAEPAIAGAGSSAWAWQGQAIEARFTPVNYRDVA